MAAKKNRPASKHGELDKTETAVTLLPKPNDVKTKPKSKLKRRTIVLLMILSILLVISVIIALLLFADFTLSLRCLILKWIGLTLTQCQKADTLESLAHSNSSSHKSVAAEVSCSGKDCTYTNFSQNAEYLAIAESTWNTAIEILTDEQGWEVVRGADLKTGKVSSKSYKNFGQVSKLEGYVDCSPEDLYKILVQDVADMPVWDPLIVQSEILEQVSENVDIHYMIAYLPGRVSTKRDYVTVRQWREVDGITVYVGGYIDYPDKPPTKEYVRAKIRPGGMVFNPVSGNKNRCRIVMSVSLDVGGWVPQWVVNNNAPASVMDILMNARKRCKELYH